MKKTLKKYILIIILSFYISTSFNIKIYSENEESNVEEIVETVEEDTKEEETNNVEDIAEEDQEQDIENEADIEEQFDIEPTTDVDELEDGDEPYVDTEETEADNNVIETADLIKEDVIGGDVTYSLYSDGTLIINGYDSLAFDYSDDIHLIDEYESVKNIVVEEGITSLEYQIFYDFINLKTISLPDTLESIGPNVFKNCYSLTEITIPSSVESIYGYDLLQSPFYGCTSLSTIHLQNNNYSNWGEFWNCISEDNYANIDVDLEEIGMFKSARLTSNALLSQNEEEYWSSLDKNVEKIEIPEGITYIPEYAFNKNKTIKEIIFPSTLKRIGKYAFNMCEHLKDVDFPDGVEFIGEYAFYDCYSFTRVILPKELTTLGKFAFTNIATNKYVIINSKLDSLEDHVFEDNRGLEDVYFEENSQLRFIDKSALRDCSSLKKMFIPISVETISGNSANTHNYPFGSSVVNFTIYLEASSAPESWGPYWMGNATRIVYNTSWEDYNSACGFYNYSINFNGNGNDDGNVDPMESLDTFQLYKLNKNTYHKIGYSFKKWNTKSDGTGLNYNDEQTVKNLGTYENEVVTLYAQWSKEKYTITYNLNGGTNNSNNIKTYDIETSFTFLDPTKKGYTFEGWYDEEGNKIIAIEKNSEGNLILNARWYSKEYTITYNLNGGENNPNNISTYNVETTFKFLDSTKKGYTFEGWYDDNNKRVYNIKANSVGDITLNAKWKIANYSIKYVLNGGKNNSKNISKYNIETNFNLLDASKVGYKFGGWYDNADSDGDRINTINNRTENLVLYAKFTDQIQYNIILSTGLDNDNYPEDYVISNVAYSDNINLANYNLDRIGGGATITGYYAYINGKKVTYSKNKVLSKLTTIDNENIYLYAVYKYNKTASISYTLNGGTNSSNNPKSYNVDSEFVFEEPTRKGYMFKGWYTSYNKVNNEYSNQIFSISLNSPIKNLVLYAKWEPIKYSIKFESGNDERYVGSMENMELSYGETKSLNPNNFSHISNGARFNGWQTIINGRLVKYNNKANVKNLSSTNGDEIVLTAIWKYPSSSVYKITYNLNGGKNVANNISTCNVDTVFKLYDASRTGYEFAGWYLDAEFNTKIERISYPKANITLYAKWIPVEYNITYHNNNADSEISLPNKYSIENQITLSTPIKYGYTFAGWYLTSDYKNQVSVIKKGTTGDIDLYRWNINTYKITYEVNGGTISSNITKNFNINTETFELYIPERKGYIFNGWFLENGTKIENINKGTYEDITVVADWIKEEYSISYYVDQEIADTYNPLKYTVEDSINRFATPKKEGYTFDGWYKDSNYKTKINGIAKGTTGDINVYGRWKTIEYKITYNLNGGINSNDNPRTYNATSVINFMEASKTGYQFCGWYSDKNFTNKVTSLINSTGNIVLYAKWEENIYNIFYNYFGGDTINNQLTYTINDTFTLKNPTRSGYTFAGWYSDSEYNTKVNSIKKGTYGDIYLYAKWNVVTYKIKYVLNGGTNVTTNLDTYNVNTSFELDEPSKYGYTFVNWYNNAKFNGSPITEIDGDSTGDITLYAKYTPITYSIKYNCDDAINSNPTTYNIESNFNLKNPERDGYIFVGWYKDSTFKNKINSIKKGTTNDIELYAKWETKKYKIKYYMNGGKNSLDNPYNYTIVSKIIFNNPQERKGYVFDGWYNNSDFEGDKIISIESGNTGDITLYAKFIPIQYKINYYDDDLKIKEDTYTIESSYNLDKISKIGYSFAGWFTGDNKQKRISRITKGTTGDVDVYVKWNINTYKINYRLCGGNNQANAIKKYNITQEVILPSSPKRNGYIFDGWYDNKEYIGNSITKIPSGSSGDITLYAKWSKNNNFEYENISNYFQINFIRRG